MELIQPLAPRPVLLLVIKYAITGGAQYHVLQLARAFRQDYDVHLAVGEWGDICESCEEEGIPVHVLPSFGGGANLYKLLTMKRDLERLFLDLRPGLVHLHSPLLGVVGRYVCWRRRVSCVTSIHSWNFVPHMPITRRLSSWVLEFMVARLGQIIVTVSKYDYQVGLTYKIASRQQMVPIHNGLPDVVYQKRYSEKNEYPIIIMVARFDDRKCQHELIEAFSGLQHECRLWLAGEGPLLAACIKQAKALGVEGKVSFLGNRNDIQELLARADIAVLATEVEGLPLALIEAMRAGLPLVANNVGGVPELIDDGKNGVLVPVNDVAKLKSALAYLLSTPGLAKDMGEVSRRLFTECFSEELMLKRIRECYSKALIG